MDFASRIKPSVNWPGSAPSFRFHELVFRRAERVSLPLLAGSTIAGLILYSEAMGMTFGRLITFAGILVAGAISGVSGLAFPLIAGPVFMLMYPAQEAVALTAMCSLTGQLFSVALLQRTIGYEFRARLIAAGLLGAPLGSALLCSVNPHGIRLILGGLIVASGLWRSLRTKARTLKNQPWFVEVLVGLSGGLTGGLVGASSVAPAIWYAACGLDQSRQRAVTQPYILVMQTASLISLWGWGALDRDLPGQYASFVLPVLVGVALGVAGFHRLSSSAATRVAMGAVTASGFSLFFL